MRDDVLRGDLPITDGGEHSVGVREIEVVGHTDQCLGGQQRIDRQVTFAHSAGQFVAAFLNSLGTTFLREPLADLVSCLRALDEAQPVARRTGGIGLGSQDLHGVAVVERGVERHQTPVDARAHRTVAHFGMHGIGEIDRCGMGRQRDDLALRREDIDFGRAEVFLQGTEEFVGIWGFRSPIG